MIAIDPRSGCLCQLKIAADPRQLVDVVAWRPDRYMDQWYSGEPPYHVLNFIDVPMNYEYKPKALWIPGMDTPLQ